MVRKACVLAVVGVAATAQAQFIGNITGNPSTSLGTIITGEQARSKAVGFTVPAGPGYSLDGVRMLLDFDSPTTPGGTPEVSIWSGAAAPTSQLTSLTPTTPVGSGVGVFSFSPSSTFIMNGGETYWVLINGAAGNTGQFYWLTESPTVEPTGDATFVGYRFSSTTTPPTGTSSVFNAFSVSATLIPAPASLALLGLGGLVATRRRR